MKREIKFRGKRVDNGQWAYGDLSVEYDGTTIISYWASVLLEPENNYSEMTSCSFEVVPETVGQYINRKDKDGKDIYESDIVDVVDGADGLINEMKAGRYKVVYSQVDCAFILEQLDGKNGIAFDECMLLTVVGNIHDNPELIK